MKTNPQIYLLCGEASGDLHAANLVAAWKQISPAIQFRGWGGDRLQQEGVHLDKHIRELSFMGFWEVFKNLPVIRKQFKAIQQQLLSQKPDLLILVDYPGFNLRMAKWAKDHGIKVLYYISPTVWAWKQKRVLKIQKYVDQLYCILPFEPAFYAKFGVQVHYFGHPLLDEIERYRSLAPKHQQHQQHFDKPVLALLPGSRKQELHRLLPRMLEAAQAFEQTHQIHLVCAPHIPLAFYESFGLNAAIQCVQSHTYDTLCHADMALVTSGTATLETALFEVPQVVCYRSSALSIWLAKKLVHIKYISLVNLILDQLVVTELIQERCTVQNMVAELHSIAPETTGRAMQIEQYRRLKSQLFLQESPSSLVAKSMHTYL
ncbi:MAG: lipid-A-disaccharide synthase [Flavobacteriales bacterium]